MVIIVRKKALISTLSLIFSSVMAMHLLAYFTGNALLAVAGSFSVATLWWLINRQYFKCSLCNKSIFDRKGVGVSIWSAKTCSHCGADVRKM
jgi:hypothetical protein